MFTQFELKEVQVHFCPACQNQKMTGLYELGVFGEDESEEFKRK